MRCISWSADPQQTQPEISSQTLLLGLFFISKLNRAKKQTQTLIVSAAQLLDKFLAQVWQTPHTTGEKRSPEINPVRLDVVTFFWRMRAV